MNFFRYINLLDKDDDKRVHGMKLYDKVTQLDKYKGLKN